MHFATYNRSLSLCAPATFIWVSFAFANQWHSLNFGTSFGLGGSFPLWYKFQPGLFALSQLYLSLFALAIQWQFLNFGMSTVSGLFHSPNEFLPCLFALSQLLSRLHLQINDIAWALECHPIWVDPFHFCVELQPGLFALSQSVSFCLTNQMVANYSLVSFAIKQIYSFAIKQIEDVLWCHCLNAFKVNGA